jgi:hypothetical protein
MLVEDHFRSWKQYQRRSAKIDIQTDRWLQQAAVDQDGAVQPERLERRILEQRSTYFAPDRRVSLARETLAGVAGPGRP